MADEQKKFDDKGHLPESPVPNKEQLNVHAGMILDKGTAVGQTRQDPENLTRAAAKLQVARAAIPTTADDPRVQDPHPDPAFRGLEEEDLKIPEDARPEKLAQTQTDDNETAAKNQKELEEGQQDSFQKHRTLFRPNDRMGMHEHRVLPGVRDGAIPGSRSGNPLEVGAEHRLGDKVHDIQDDGSSVLKVQTRDKSVAFPHTGVENEGDLIQRMKVSFTFPGINPHVAQKELAIQIGNNDPCIKYLPPDVPNLEVLVTPDEQVHVELTHIDQNGARSNPYILDFYSNNAVVPRPLEASPIGFRLMEMVMTRAQPRAAEQPKAPEPPRAPEPSRAPEQATAAPKAPPKAPPPAPPKAPPKAPEPPRAPEPPKTGKKEEDFLIKT